MTAAATTNDIQPVLQAKDLVKNYRRVVEAVERLGLDVRDGGGARREHEGEKGEGSGNRPRCSAGSGAW